MIYNYNFCERATSSTQRVNSLHRTMNVINSVTLPQSRGANFHLSHQMTLVSTWHPISASKALKKALPTQSFINHKRAVFIRECLHHSLISVLVLKSEIGVFFIISEFSDTFVFCSLIHRNSLILWRCDFFQTSYPSKQWYSTIHQLWWQMWKIVILKQQDYFITCSHLTIRFDSFLYRYEQKMNSWNKLYSFCTSKKWFQEIGFNLLLCTYSPSEARITPWWWWAWRLPTILNLF